MTVACFGVDSRSEHGQMNVGKGTNADVNMIANINLETGEIRLVSVFRDSYLNITIKTLIIRSTPLTHRRSGAGS